MCYFATAIYSIRVYQIVAITLSGSAGRRGRLRKRTQSADRYLGMRPVRLLFGLAGQRIILSSVYRPECRRPACRAFCILCSFKHPTPCLAPPLYTSLQIAPECNLSGIDVITYTHTHIYTLGHIYTRPHSDSFRTILL